MTTATFPPFPPGSLSRQRSLTTVSVVSAGFMSLALALFRTICMYISKEQLDNLTIDGRYFSDLLKQGWTTACNWVTGGALQNCDSHSNLFPIVCLHYSSKLIPTDQHFDSKENEP